MKVKETAASNGLAPIVPGEKHRVSTEEEVNYKVTLCILLDGAYCTKFED